MPAFVEHQKSLLARFPHVRRLYCVGSSGGAYAAILSGYFLAVEQVFAFAPPVPLERRWIQHQPGPGEAPRYRDTEDLSQLLRGGNGKTCYRIYYNESSVPDRRSARRIAQCPGVSLAPQSGHGHNVMDHLSASGRLDSLLPAYERV